MKISRAKSIGYLGGMALWLFCSSVLCYDLGQIKGTVRDSLSGARLAGVSVEIIDRNRKTVSDSLGHFRFFKVNSGNLSLLFVRDDYDSTLLVDVRVYPELTSEHEISLNRCDSIDGCGNVSVLAIQPSVTVCTPTRRGVYKGVVTNNDGNPIEGAIIDIVQKDTVVVTDSIGMYVIEVSGRSFTIRCSAEGYWSSIRYQVSLLDKRSLIVNFRLYRR